MLLSGEEVKADDNLPIFGLLSIWSVLCTAAWVKKLLLIIGKIGDSAFHPFRIATSNVILITYLSKVNID